MFEDTVQEHTNFYDEVSNDLYYDELERDYDERYEYEREDEEYYMDEDEYNGQPDEAQEWYDFDPDC